MADDSAFTISSVQSPMQQAIALASEAASRGEVPVGAVIVQGGVVIAAAANGMRARNDPTAHAELLAIRAACQALGSSVLADCDLYVTLEPCPMCAGAIAWAQLRRLYYAAPDPRRGAIDHGCRLFASTDAFHRPEVIAGLEEAAARQLLQQFFEGLRD
jgi:tRNA(adenine34) deaminase